MRAVIFGSGSIAWRCADEMPGSQTTDLSLPGNRGSGASRRQLLQHAGSCKRCARELQEAEGARLFLSECQSMEPELNAVRNMTEQIMRSVEMPPTIDARSGARRESPLFRRLQFGCTLAAAAIAMVFFPEHFRLFPYFTTGITSQPDAERHAGDARRTASCRGGIQHDRGNQQVPDTIAVNNDSRAPGTPAPQRKRPLLL